MHGQQQQKTTPHERIGRYEVLRKIATGGMAELFLAKHVGMEGFEKVVAIKRILSHLAYDEEFINMFRDEARLVAKLSHQNIVQIYDLGKSNDSYFIAMEYIPGRNLASVAKKAKQKGQSLPPVYIARCIAQACEALHYAHTRTDLDGRPMGIVHRDVSPQNIIVAFSGGVKLVDFGIAKAATKIAHTRAGVLKGKYAYMSPEQIRGEEIDARSDLFSVGIVLYELLCGKRPFEKDNSIQTLKAIVQEAHVDCRQLNSAIPDPLADVINKALTKNRDQRYATAQDVQLALEDFVAHTGERCNNVVIGEWMTQLFEDELERGKAATISFKGGEVILPPEEKKEDRESSADEVALADLDVSEDNPPSNASASASQSQDDQDDPVVLQRGRGGGSVDSGPEAPSRRRGTSMARANLIEEGVIASNRARKAVSDEDEATALAKDEKAPDHAEALRAVGRASSGIGAGGRDYEEGVRGQPNSEAPGYDDSRTEHVPSGSPLAHSFGAGDDREPTIDFSKSPKLFPEPQVPSIKSEIDSAPLARANDDEIRRAMAEAMEAAADDIPEASEDDVDVASSSDDDLWNEKTTANPGSSDNNSGGVRVIGDDPWEEKTTGMPEGLGAMIEAGLDPSFGADAEPQIATIAGDDDVWNEKTTATPDDADAADPTGGVKIFDDAGPWSDKTAAADDSLDGPVPPRSFRGDDTVGMSVEELAAKVSESRMVEAYDPGGETYEAGPRSTPPESTGDIDADATEWGRASSTDSTRDGSEPWGGPQKRASLTIGDEMELPKGIDRKRNVESDSRTIAATASAYEDEGIEIPASGAFAYDPKEQENTSSIATTGRLESPAAAARNNLGAIKLAKVAAAPKGGVRELEIDLDEREPATGEERTGELDYATEELDKDELSAAKREQPLPLVAPPAPGAQKKPPPKAISEMALGFDEDRDESTREEPPLPPGGALGSMSELEELFAPRPMPPLSKPDPLAKIGSTRVPPANVSLSEMLVDSTGQHRAPKKPAPPAVPPPSQERAPAPKVRGASLNRSVLRDIKEVRKSAAESAPPPAASPMSASVLGLGTPVKNGTQVPQIEPNAGYYPPPQQQELQVPMPAPQQGSRLTLLHIIVIAFCAIAIAAVSTALIYVNLRSPSLEIATVPAGAQIYIDGRLLEGVTPLSVPIEPEQEYKLKIVREGYYAQTQPVRIPKGKRAWKATFNLKELPKGETPPP